MKSRRSGKDYTVFSAEIEGEPGLLLAENSIHLTSVPGEQIYKFVKNASGEISSGFRYENGRSGSGPLVGGYWLAIAVEEGSTKCIGYFCRWDGR